MITIALCFYTIPETTVSTERANGILLLGYRNNPSLFKQVFHPTYIGSITGLARKVPYSTVPKTMNDSASQASSPAGTDEIDSERNREWHLQAAELAEESGKKYEAYVSGYLTARAC